MRTFNIVNKPTGIVLGTLRYDPVTETGTIHVSTRIQHMGLVMRMCYDKGIYDLDNDKVMMWAENRVCSPSRPDINIILHNLGLDHYNALSMTVALKETCTDNDTLVEVFDS